MLVNVLYLLGTYLLGANWQLYPWPPFFLQELRLDHPPS